MSIDPLLDAPSIIVLHATTAIAAFVLGLLQLLGAKGTTRHRRLGWTWAALMLTVAASSFWIGDMRWVGSLGPIHLLSLLVLVNVPLGVLHARRGRVPQHARVMQMLFVFALLVAGALTMLPGRLMGEVVFGWPARERVPAADPASPLP